MSSLEKNKELLRFYGYDEGQILEVTSFYSSSLNHDNFCEQLRRRFYSSNSINEICSILGVSFYDDVEFEAESEVESETDDVSFDDFIEMLKSSGLSIPSKIKQFRDYYDSEPYARRLLWNRLLYFRRVRWAKWRGRKGFIEDFWTKKERQDWSIPNDDVFECAGNIGKDKYLIRTCVPSKKVMREKEKEFRSMSSWDFSEEMFDNWVETYTIRYR